MRGAQAHQLNAGSLLRALTIVLTGLLLVLGALAAHHAENTTEEAPHLTVTALEDTHALTDSATQGAPALNQTVLVGLAAGCAVLAICCLIAMALLNRAHWSALLARYLGALLPGAAKFSGVSPATVSAIPAPSLITLSISRT